MCSYHVTYVFQTHKVKLTPQITFLGDVKAISVKTVFLATDILVNDINRFCSGFHKWSVLREDQTLNICDNYTTITTCKHPCLVKNNINGPPVMIGPILIHSKIIFNSYSV